MRQIICLSALIIITSTYALNANAALTVYEGFSDYAQSSDILSSPGGTGFSDGWQPGEAVLTNGVVPDPSSVQLLPNSLSYSDGNGDVLVTSGGSMFLTGQFGSTKVARTYDQSALPHPAPPHSPTAPPLGESTYLSFLARRSGEPADPDDPVYGGNYPYGDNLYPRVAGVTMYSNDGGDQVQLLIGNLSNQQEDVWRLAGQDLDDQNPPPRTDQPFGEGSNTYFVVMRIDHSAGDGDGDRMYFYLNPLLASEASNTPDLTENWEADDDPLHLPGDWLAVEVGNNSSNRPFSEFTFDEYRIGDSWADVTPFSAIPEPSSLPNLLLAVSLAGSRRSRRENEAKSGK